jgi:hypothetical protein
MQRQLRLGDILDDYCPRERRVTNHAVVAMVGADVKQTRCTTCDAEHEYKHAKIPRQRRKSETPAALYSQVLAGGPKLHGHAAAGDERMEDGAPSELTIPPSEHAERGIAEEPGTNGTPAPTHHPSETPPVETSIAGRDEDEEREGDDRQAEDEGPVHRPLIRASLPRAEGQAPPSRTLPEFTIRQPGGRANRFRPRHQRGAGGGPMFHGNRSNGGMGGGQARGGAPRHGGNRPPMKRHGNAGGGGGRKRSK